MNKIVVVVFCICFQLSCNEKPTELTKLVDSKFEWSQVQKLNPAFDESLDGLIHEIEAGKYGYIDEIFIAKGDSLLVATKFKNDYDLIGGEMTGKMGCGYKVCEDSTKVNIYNYYHSKYHPYYQEQDIHTLQSITKSVLSTVIGVAIQNGKLSGVDETVFKYFKEYDLTKEMEEHLKLTTIKDLLAMQFGVVWNEFGMSLEMDESNVSEMELSDDWVQYVLSQPIEAAPGQKWNYNSGASQLLSEIMQQATGVTLSAYAQKRLFEKLDIEEHFWKSTPKGSTDAEGGLYLTIEDLGKIARLYFQEGIWQGKRILPDGWAQKSFVKHAQDIYGDGGTEGYGFQWWMTGHQPALAVGLGYGNQILVLKPAEEVIGIVYAWNIFDREGEYILTDLLSILEAVE